MNMNEARLRSEATILTERLRKAKSDLIRTIERRMPVLTPREKVQLESMRVYIDERIRLIQDQINQSERSLFISFSDTPTGRAKCEIVKDLVKKNKRMDFKIKNGFDENSKHEYGHSDNVLGKVKRRIKTSTCFLGIMTPDTALPLGRSELQYCPSIWVAEEKGMALALEKPFHLLVHATVHEDFWKKTTPEVLHTIFTDDDFREKARDALDKLREKVENSIWRKLYGKEE